MERCHAQAYAAVGGVLDPRLRPRLEVVADVAAEGAARCASRFGFRRHATDWRAAVDDPRVALVSITSPNVLHKEMALAVIAAGKHVWCEKPLALTAAGARELADAAEARGVTAVIGYDHLR